MQVTLLALTQEHDQARARLLLPTLEQDLNSEQLEAFRHTDGPALVLAGAGSGKTAVLTRRAARLLSEGVPADQVFVATFTKKAAEEMTERLLALLGADSGPGLVEKLWIGTFHSHCLRILKTEWSRIRGKAGYFQIADEHWQKRVARAILGDKEWLARGLPTPPFGLNMAYDPKSAISAISAVKNRGHLVKEAERALREHMPWAADGTIQTLCKFWRNYEMAKEARFDLLSKKASRRLDFDDLLIETLNLLQTDRDSLVRYQQQFQYLLIDETQDTSAIQWEIARLLAAERKNIFIVGDIGQAIYSFRGADPNSTIAQFSGAYPNGQILRLPTNYRSSATIVRVANELIEQAGMDERFRIKMAPSLDEGDQPLVSEHDDPESEAESIAESLSDGLHRGRDLSDCAVLFRTNAYSRALEDAFIKKGIPYRLEGALGFYGRREVRDLIAFLHLSVERDTSAADEAAKRILNVPSKAFGRPTHFLGAAFVSQVEAEAAKRGVSFYRALADGRFKTAQGLAVKDFREIIRQVAAAGIKADERLRKARELGYDDFLSREEGVYEDEGNSRLDNLEELCVASSVFPSARDYLNFVLAQQQKSAEDPGGDCVEMMTIHRAKGLEWPAVFVAGFAHGLIPHFRSVRWFDEDKKTRMIPESIEEERRLAYVAITRAKHELHLSWPLQHQNRKLSRTQFLAEMPSLPEATVFTIFDSAEPENDTLAEGS